MTEFVVRVPDPDNPDPVFLSGDVPELGRWHSRGFPLNRIEPTVFQGFVPLPHGRPVRFLATRGHWRDAEQDENGREPWPREFTPHGENSRHELTVAGWGRDSVKYHPDFKSEFLSHHQHGLNVHLPPGYDQKPEPRYPVVYMHDGQNLFDRETAFAHNPWRCDEAAEQAARQREAAPVIIVGVANTPDRLREYGPRRCGKDRASDLSRLYGRMLVEEVKPFIDRTYRTRPEPHHTAIGGSSMGGLISLHLCKWFPGVFGRCAALSPSLWWDEEYFLHSMNAAPAWLKTCRVWLSMGGQEGGTARGKAAALGRAKALARRLKRQKADYKFVEDPDGGHNEHAWGHLYGDVLRYLFPPER